AAHARPTQTFLHPQGRLAGHVDAADHPTDVTGAGCGRLDPDIETGVRRGRNGDDPGLPHRQPVQHPQLPGETRHTQAVAPVGGEIDVDDTVVESEIDGDIGPDGR